ncbi:MAG: putative toxin-antitoxin system toxin component, PIN family [Actinobacteria bacterium]|nr:putative toxin-antitoxin system toxin component, PIN family [Actinomycetota bacterium]
MRVFFDTNVLISAFIAHGTSSEVFEHCLSSCQVYTSPFILDELKDVLSSKLHLSVSRIKEISEFLMNNLELVEAGSLEEKVCRDHDDDFVLAGALAAAADCLITGDEDLLVIKEYKGIRIIRPIDFWRFEKVFGSALE